MSTYLLYAVGALLIFFGLTLFSIGNIFMSFASFVLGFLAVNQGVKIKKETEIEQKDSFIDPETGKFYVREDKLEDKGKLKTDDREENTNLE